jgi:hypothetical protein
MLMAGLTGEIEFYTNPGSMDPHDLRVKITQDFEVIHGEEGFELKAYDKPEVAIYAGHMLLWAGKPEEMSGWLKEAVDGRIKAGEWGITDEDMMDAIAEDAEHAEFIRDHAPGVI